MKDDKMKIEQRIRNMKNFYVKTAELIDKLPDAVPEKARNIISADKVEPVKDIKDLHDGAVEYGRVDKNDTALFAKNGGPFDKLFNGVFGRIDDIYNNIFNSSSNTNIGNDV